MKFRIPNPSDAAGQAFDDSDSEVAQPQMSDSRVFAPVGEKPAPAREEQIEFLCPNGHRLHGPARLQGRPGQCPECGSRFRIPSYDDIPDQEEQEDHEEIAVGRADGGDASASSLTWGDAPPPHTQHGGTPLATGGTRTASPPVPTRSGVAPASLAALFPALWAQRPQGAVVELHLGDGEIVVPQRFSSERSAEEVGLFAVREDDESFTVYAIPWRKVARVVVRHLDRLPPDLTD